MHLTAILHY